jgi:hypothetical protein
MYVLTILNTILIVIAFVIIISMTRTLTLACKMILKINEALKYAEMSADISEDDDPICDINTPNEELELIEICTTGPNGENIDLLIKYFDQKFKTK